MKALKEAWDRVERFFGIDAHREMKRSMTVGQDSRDLEGYSNQELIEDMNREAYVRLADFRGFFQQICRREPYDVSSYDERSFGLPFFRLIQSKVEKGEIEGYLGVKEKVEHDTRVKVGDVLDLIAQTDLPNGDIYTRSIKEIIEPVDPTEFSDDLLGQFQRYMNENLPLRTPSSDVQIKEVVSENPLDIYRPMIMGLGYASIYREQNRIIATENIPTYQASLKAREKAAEEEANKPAPVRYYRGHRID